MTKLHEDRESFKLSLDQLHTKTGYRSDVLEKDYYILLILQELAISKPMDFLLFLKAEQHYIDISKTLDVFLKT